jgi:hypothetical protein
VWLDEAPFVSELIVSEVFCLEFPVHRSISDKNRRTRLTALLLLIPRGFRVLTRLDQRIERFIEVQMQVLIGLFDREQARCRGGVENGRLGIACVGSSYRGSNRYVFIEASRVHWSDRAVGVEIVVL